MTAAAPSAPPVLSRTVECESCGGDGLFSCCDASERGHGCRCRRPTVDCRSCAGTGVIEETRCTACGDRADEDGCFSGCAS